MYAETNKVNQKLKVISKILPTITRSVDLQLYQNENIEIPKIPLTNKILYSPALARTYMENKHN